MCSRPGREKHNLSYLPFAEDTGNNSVHGSQEAGLLCSLDSALPSPSAHRSRVLSALTAANSCWSKVVYSSENSPPGNWAGRLAPSYPLALRLLAFTELASRLTKAKSCSHFLVLHSNMPRTVLGTQTFTNNIRKGISFLK